MAEHDTKVWVAPDRAREDAFEGFRAERTVTVESTPGYACGIVQVLGPKGGEKDRWRATPEWLTECGNAMIEAAKLLRKADDPANF